MMNSEARKRTQENSATNIVQQVLENNGEEVLNLHMSNRDALIAAGDLMHAALQLLAQLVQHLSGDDDETGDAA